MPEDLACPEDVRVELHCLPVMPLIAHKAALTAKLTNDVICYYSKIGVRTKARRWAKMKLDFDVRTPHVPRIRQIGKL
jgi:hypothetical protein